MPPDPPSLCVLCTHTAWKHDANGLSTFYLLPTPLYCQILYLLFTGKQHCLQIKKYDQFRGVTEIYTPTKFCDLYDFVQDMSVKSVEEEKDEEDEHNSPS